MSYVCTMAVNQTVFAGTWSAILEALTANRDVRQHTNFSTGTGQT
jgi:hypothetical protein